MHPREILQIYGYDTIIKSFRNLLDEKRLPHAWLISGPEGIGKATLAYHLSRLVLSQKKAAARSAPSLGLFGELLETSPVDKAEDKGVDESVARKIAAGSHPDLLVIDESIAKASGEIPVEALRRVGDFFSLSPAESDWRVVLVDAADDMNSNAANALLKTLEEPPTNALILLISHNSGKLIPTIRSRCRVLKLPPLEKDSYLQVIRGQIDEYEQLTELEELYPLANGSPGLALQMQQAGAWLHYQLIESMFHRFPLIPVDKMKALFQAVEKKGDNESWRWICYMLQYVIHHIISYLSEVTVPQESNLSAETLRSCQARHLEWWMDFAQYVRSKIDDADRINLDRRLVIADIFSRVS